MSAETVIEDLIQQRFDNLFLDVKAAQLNLQNEKKPTLNVVERAQSKTSRALLNVEKQAIKQKDIDEKIDLNILKTVAGNINVEVEQRLQNDFKDPNNLYSKVLGLDTELPKLLDLVCVKAATISKIEPVANELPWLFNDLMKFVNQSKYQRIDKNEEVIVVDTMRKGLSFFGLENLVLILSTLAFRRTLPQITDPFPQIKLRIWEEAIATANSCKQIASLVGVRQNDAFCLGMLQMMGKVVVTKLFFRQFEKVQREALIASQKELKHEDYAALTRLTPSGTFLNQLIDKYALTISANLLDNMAMKRIFIANAMRELSSHQPASNLSPLARVLKQGTAYAQYRLLSFHKLIDLQQSKDFIGTLDLPKGSLKLLKATDMRSLNLKV